MKTLAWSGALLGCLALLIAVMIGGAGPAVDPPAIAPPPATPDSASFVPLAPSIAPAAAAREVAGWLPDGRLWIRVSNAADEPLQRVLCGWGASADRCVRAEAAARQNGEWLGIVVPDQPAGIVLFVAAPGYQSAVLADLATDRRHAVVLSVSSAISARVRDVDTWKPIADAVVRVSRQPFGGADMPGEWIAGVDPTNAIYTARSDVDGQLGFDLATLDADRPSIGTWCYDAQHATYLTTALVGDQLELGGGPAICVDMQMPAVGAIHYVNGGIYQSSLRVAAGPTPSEVPRTVQERLAALRKQLARDRDTVALALLPYRKVFHGKTPPVQARVTLRRGGARKDAMVMQRLDQFAGPQVVMCDPNAPELVIAHVVFLSPGALGDPANPHGLDVTISGSKEFGLVKTKLGETVDLPVGSYRLSVPLAWDGAFERETHSVRDGSDHVFQVHWRKDVRIHVVDVVGPPIGSLAQLRFQRDGVSFLADTFIDDKGRAKFWMSSALRSGDLFVRGFMEEPVVFHQSNQPNLFQGTCAVNRVRQKQ